MNDRLELSGTELSADGPNAGTVKIHGLDDTKRISESAHRIARTANVRLVEVQVTDGSYAGVIYVIDPDYPYEKEG